MIFYPEEFAKIRAKSGLTLKQIALAVGVAESSVHNWEHGKNAPRNARIRKLAELLHCSPEEFADYEPGESNPKRLTMEEVAMRGAAVRVDLPAPKAVEAFRQGLLREIMTDKQLNAEAKVAVYNIVLNFRKQTNVSEEK